MSVGGISQTLSNLYADSISFFNMDYFNWVQLGSWGGTEEDTVVSIQCWLLLCQLNIRLWKIKYYTHELWSDSEYWKKSPDFYRIAL